MSTLLQFDWDGVMTSNPEWTPVYQDVDVTPIREAHRRGYIVAILTCSPLGQVAEELRKHGFRTETDHRLYHNQWTGGSDGRVILVTQKKLWGGYIVDDKAVNYCQGLRTMPDLFAEIGATVAGGESRKRGSARRGRAS